MKYLINTFWIILLSCSVNTTYNNRESDKQDAEQVTEQLYRFLKANEPHKALGLFSPKFFAITDTNQLYKLIDTSIKHSGHIDSYILANWQTNIIKGTNAQSNYVLMYVVRRDKEDTKETITLQKEGDVIKILGYDVRW